MAWWSGGCRFFLEHRRRFATVVLAVGLFVAGREVLSAYPREVALRYRLGPTHETVVGLTLSYRTEGDESAGVRFSWPEGAPSEVEHQVDLPPGRYEVRAEVFHRDGHRRAVRRFHVPTDGVVRFDLYSVGYAGPVSRDIPAG